ncbi:MAG: mycothiol synthase [Aquihabitans sp.]
MPEPSSTPSLASSGHVAVQRDGRPIGITLRWLRRDPSAEIELVRTAPPLADDGAGESQLSASEPDSEALNAVAVSLRSLDRDLSGCTTHLAGEHPPETLDPLIEAAADAAGFTDRRELLQLRRSLPVPADHPGRGTTPLPLRAFVPGTDDDAWLRVNNRAFASHPDQGQQTNATLRAQRAEPWFDPAGFLVADDPSRPGELSGFCWTKVHEATDIDPALGEIYVIGVDPAHRGEGLGPVFTMAGLDYLAAKDLDTAVLYVEADNEPALRLYDRLGFATHRRRRVYNRPVKTPGTQS